MMTKAIAVTAMAAASVAGCGRSALTVSRDADANAGLQAGGTSGLGGTGAGGQAGSQGGGGNGGAGGLPVVFRLPDGGLSALLGDSGILGGILDAPRDSLLGQVICSPEARLGAPCSMATPGCVLPSLGGACVCVNGTYLCPLTNEGPKACPAGAATDKPCLSPLTTCMGGGANACICGLGTYTCF